jgi:hypothetical protein
MKLSPQCYFRQDANLPCGIQIADFNWLTTSLNPAFSPRRRRIILRQLGNSRDWICRMISRKQKTGIAVPSPGGEG